MSYKYLYDDWSSYALLGVSSPRLRQLSEGPFFAWAHDEARSLQNAPMRRFAERTAATPDIRRYRWVDAA
jgi:hypothetical protein